PSGIIATIDTFPDVRFSEVATETIRVFRRETSWTFASELAADPDTVALSETTFLPRVPDGSGFRDYVREIYRWDEIPRTAGDLADGSGERFTVEETADGGVHIRLFVGRDGVYQAFIED
ncbi:MAG: hypothetical protein AAFY60_16015, partial [Myxococcota bacterium]